MTANEYKYGQLLSVFMSLLDDKEKRRTHIVKINDAIRRVHHFPKVNVDKEYYIAADIVENAIKKSWDDIPHGENITINALAWMLLNRHQKELKKYKFNIKHFEKMSRTGVSGYALKTAKVLNIIESYLEVENA